jgi:hypothetical protein
MMKMPHPWFPSLKEHSMREKSRRCLRGMARVPRRAGHALSIEYLESRLTLSHAPFAPANDFEPLSVGPLDATSSMSPQGSSWESASALYGTPYGLPSGLGFVGEQASGPPTGVMPFADHFGGIEASQGPRSIFATNDAQSMVGGSAATNAAPQPSIELALLVPNGGQFLYTAQINPLLVIIVDQSIVAVVPTSSAPRTYAPTNLAAHEAEPGGTGGYGGYGDGPLAHMEINGPAQGKSVAPPAAGGPRGAGPSPTMVALPQASNPRELGESAAPSDNSAAGRISIATSSGAMPSFTVPTTPALAMPSLGQRDGALGSTFGLLVPPAEAAAAPRRDSTEAAAPSEAQVDAEQTPANAGVETADAAKIAVTPGASQMTQTAAMLEGIGLRIDAVDQALEGALTEIERLGGELASWLGEFGLDGWVTPTSAAVALGAGAYFGLRGTRTATNDKHDEESSSWLFSRLQTPTPHA